MEFMMKFKLAVQFDKIRRISAVKSNCYLVECWQNFDRFLAKSWLKVDPHYYCTVWGQMRLIARNFPYSTWVVHRLCDNWLCLCLHKIYRHRDHYPLHEINRHHDHYPLHKINRHHHYHICYHILFFLCGKSIKTSKFSS